MTIPEPPRSEVQRFAEAWTRALRREDAPAYPDESARRDLQESAASVFRDYLVFAGENLPDPLSAVMGAILVELATGDVLVSRRWPQTPVYALPLPALRQSWPIMEREGVLEWCADRGFPITPPADTDPGAIVLPFVAPGVIEPEAIRRSFALALRSFDTVCIMLQGAHGRRRLADGTDGQIRYALELILTSRWRARQLGQASAERAAFAKAGREIEMTDRTQREAVIETMDLELISMATMGNIGVTLFRIAMDLRDDPDVVFDARHLAAVENVLEAKPLRAWASGELGGPDLTVG